MTKRTKYTDSIAKVPTKRYEIDSLSIYDQILNKLPNQGYKITYLYP